MQNGGRLVQAGVFQHGQEFRSVGMVLAPENILSVEFRLAHHRFLKAHEHGRFRPVTLAQLDERGHFTEG